MKSYFRQRVLLVSWVLAYLSLTACFCPPKMQVVPNPDIERKSGTHAQPEEGRIIEVYLDGTRNKWDSRTNVRRRFEMVAATEDPTQQCLYVDGVGNQSPAAAALGLGMKCRILESYKFLSKHWQPGMRIRIFGFSRGAFQARALAGLMAHCGLPTGEMDDSTRAKIAEEMFKYSENSLRDCDSMEASAWHKCLAENRGKAAAHIREKFGDGVAFANPDIEFMGLWDTVPGLVLKKKDLQGVGDLKDGGGTRYKVRPYPNIRLIAHALSLDEDRNAFTPLLVGGPLDPARTTVHEVWFPGVHCDIGGGYEDSNDMAGVTFNWMHRILYEKQVVKRRSVVYADATSLMHRESNPFYDWFRGRRHRVMPTGSAIDKTVFIRTRGGAYPQQESHGFQNKTYTPTLLVRNKDGSGVESITVVPTRDPAELLKGMLVLNDSDAAASSQKKAHTILSPENMQFLPQKSEPEKPKSTSGLESLLPAPILKSQAESEDKPGEETGTKKESGM